MLNANIFMIILYCLFFAEARMEVDQKFNVLPSIKNVVLLFVLIFPYFP